jgi:DNA-binding response OmpR family regulator
MSAKPRILLVDDDQTILETLRIVLEEIGYLVDTASTGEQAINQSNINVYNLAIVDWRLPDIEGTKLLSKFRETSPRMMKIMLTGFPSMQNAIDSVNAQADAFFQKPADPQKLLNKIEELLVQQKKLKDYDERKVADFIQSRCTELLSKKVSPP